MNRQEMKSYRQFLKTLKWDEWQTHDTGQRMKTPPPPVQKTYPEASTLIELVKPEDLSIGNISLLDAINGRKSHRKFEAESLNLEELSFLLWATQGVRKTNTEGTTTLRTVPSGGSRHPFETYLAINRVKGVTPGLYRYLPLDHKLCFIESDADLMQRIKKACLDQKFIAEGAVVFIWTAIPERAEWRYSIVAHKMIAMEAGHVCQNLYLTASAIGAGTCAIGAYRNDEMDAIVGVDGTDEFVIYIAPLGKVSK